MPPGLRPNLDKKIANLIASLKRTLVAKRAAEIVSAVGRQVDVFVHGLARGVEVVHAATAPVQAAATKGKRKFSAATRAKMKRSQKARWAPVRAGKTTPGAKPKRVAKRAPRAKPAARPKAGSSWATMTPEQRAARIAKMREGRGVKAGAKQ